MNGRDVIAVVGGGPAGALAAEMLAHAGRNVVLFDEKLAWEKPCGGGITQKALQQYPFLHDATVQRNMVSACEFISPSGRRTTLELDQPIAIFSRRILNSLLLDRAQRSGADLRNERVTAIERVNSHFAVHAANTTVHANFVVLAAGARNSFRSQFYQAFQPADLMATVGYFIPGSSTAMQIRFLPRLDGYIWTFPRCDHFSAGICGRMNEIPTAELRRQLDSFLAQENYSLTGATVYAHILPAPRASTLKRIRPVGDGWALIGDAAGYVDPITGEGLYYALRSADLLAQAIISGKPQSYYDLLHRDFLPDLIEGAHYAERFYHGTFLGEHILERMVQFASESAKFGDLLRDLFSGAQGYIGLRSRAYRSLPRVICDFVASVGGWNSVRKRA